MDLFRRLLFITSFRNIRINKLITHYYGISCFHDSEASLSLNTGQVVVFVEGIVHH